MVGVDDSSFDILYGPNRWIRWRGSFGFRWFVGVVSGVGQSRLGREMETPFLKADLVVAVRLVVVDWCSSGVGRHSTSLFSFSIVGG